jgi:hypothetical protein
MHHLEEASVMSAYVQDPKLKHDEVGGVLVRDADHTTMVLWEPTMPG